MKFDVYSDSVKLISKRDIGLYSIFTAGFNAENVFQRGVFRESHVVQPWTLPRLLFR